jgi:hypothetical protein
MMARRKFDGAGAAVVLFGSLLMESEKGVQIVDGGILP